MGDLVQALLLRGVDAQGVDVSSVAVDEALRRAPGRFSLGSILDLPFPDDSFDCVVSTDCLEHIAEEDVPRALSELARVARRGVFLAIATRMDRDKRWHLTVKDRRFWETSAMEAGLRRHPSSLDVTSYEDLDLETGEISLALEPLSADMMRDWPLSALAAGRDLHMDMLREAGSRSDAHVVRYDKVARFVRAGDRVLDAACGLGYGSWLLATKTPAASVIGVDLDGEAVSYARASFVSEKLSFRDLELPEGLAAFGDGEFDVVTCFETLEHVEDPAALLARFRRLLSPGGRLFVSVPHDWSDETGRDPNPHHMDVYDWPKLTGLLSAEFSLDRAFAQTADRAKVDGAWTRQGRAWLEFDPAEDAPPFPAEWLIALAVKPALSETASPWDRGLRAAGAPSTIPPVDFANMLDNPWLGRGLLDRGLRVKQPAALRRLCDELIEAGGRRDRAAGLTVLGYQLLADRSAGSEPVAALVRAMQDWIDAADAAEPYDVRWLVSLSFVAARLSQKTGDTDAAQAWFARCLGYDAARFSPLLFTKTVEAAHRLGWLRRAHGDLEGAAAAWRLGMSEAVRALGFDAREAFGEHGLRLDFAFDELSTICETANLCAIALERLETDPANAPRQSEPLTRPREQLQTLSALLLKARAARPAAPKPTKNSAGWSLLDLRRPNKWCVPPASEDGPLNLHPTALGDADQPEAVMKLILPRNAKHAVFLAKASSASPANTGVTLRYGFVGEPEETLRRIDLAPREPATFAVPTEALATEDDGPVIRFLVSPSAVAKSVSSAGTRIVLVGTST